VRNRFQAFAFKCNLHRYNEEEEEEAAGEAGEEEAEAEEEEEQQDASPPVDGIAVDLSALHSNRSSALLVSIPTPYFTHQHGKKRN
jgi:phosphoglycolate phosphatase-like HAD superfamily hydrolase